MRKRGGKKMAGGSPTFKEGMAGKRRRMKRGHFINYIISYIYNSI